MKMTQLDRTLRALLPDNLYPESKDWREGSIVDRVEWLLVMYKSAHEEVLRLQDELDDLYDNHGERMV
jgi:hypothetical protein